MVAPRRCLRPRDFSKVGGGFDWPGQARFEMYVYRVFTAASVAVSEAGE